ncbi:MAG: acetyl-CoA carboxylase biotin carboxyl carrier protein [Planctomycetota bacterium]|jgi:acetyl-CoA carboxylase biotin carboxyl carrier protein
MATKKQPSRKCKNQNFRARKPARARKNPTKATFRATSKATRRAAVKATGGSPNKPPQKADGSDDPVAQIQRVIDLMVRNGAVEVELEEAGKRLRVRLKEDVPPATILAQPAPAVAQTEVVLPPAPARAAAAAEEETEETEEAAEGEVFVSPMVGTFYRAPAPEADPFVEVGERVAPDTTLCVIEAMKVMNEIKAEVDGEITAILVENGEPVEFGQPLFRITA